MPRTILSSRLALAALATAMGALLTSTPAAASTPRPVGEAACAAPGAKGAAARASAQGDPAARAAAQKGLRWLSVATPAWQKNNQCFGCHVQAVTLEAFTVGLHHQYDVDKGAVRDVVDGMLHLNGGARHMNGFSHQGDGILEASKAFGGSAFAHFDRDGRGHGFVDISQDLDKTARQLVELQQQDGALRSSWVNGPVGIGEIQFTYQAMQTWRQVYARSADDVWLTPLRKAETWLQAQAAAFEKAPPDETQPIDYALLGLLEAGAGPAERRVQLLRGELLERQNVDGGWGFGRHQESNAFMTGQALYVLRRLGLTDHDRSVAKATRWLVSHQGQDGSWGGGGSGKAEAMWALMGLVSIDVLSIEVAGVDDGQRLRGPQTLTARAVDNQGRGVRRVDVFVDDVRVASRCGAELSQALEPGAFGEGLHFVDVVAENGAGQTARRRLAVYTGEHYLVEPGSRYTDGGTLLSLRNLGESGEGKVELTIFQTKKGGGRGDAVFRQTLGDKKGPLQLHWKGEATGTPGGKLATDGRYEAELRFVKDGKAVQTVSHVFTHDTPEAQAARFAEVQGRLELEKGQSAANAEVELVDEVGNVVQRVRSTRQGSYRFKNVDSGKYKVRLKKAGFKDVEMDVGAAAGAPAAEASAKLEAE